MSLREELIKRLNDLNGPIFGDYKPWPKWEVIADEVIRQMEWARRECIVDDSPQSLGGPGGGSVRPSDYHSAPCTLWDEANQRSGPTVTIDDPRHPHYGTDWRRPLTLAPPEWKP